MQTPGGGCGACYLPLHLPQGGDISTHTTKVVSGDISCTVLVNRQPVARVQEHDKTVQFIWLTESRNVQVGHPRVQLADSPHTHPRDGTGRCKHRSIPGDGKSEGECCIF